ncbi:unnamed protein product [Sphenostylis stenocarpa]|uniref:Uncharacterized protein n=1 Tax=Sphenostylis stenocarpa TaxID=92480 RepID=A0AA86VF87_9FABA|nr:unnamed protein product [Sphenostylis stenocarpa]
MSPISLRLASLPNSVSRIPNSLDRSHWLSFSCEFGLSFSPCLADSREDDLHAGVSSGPSGWKLCLGGRFVGSTRSEILEQGDLPGLLVKLGVRQGQASIRPARAILHVFRIRLLLHFRVLDAIYGETIEKDLVILLYWRSKRDHAFSTSLFSHCMMESVLSSLIDAIDRSISIPFFGLDRRTD